MKQETIDFLKDLGDKDTRGDAIGLLILIVFGISLLVPLLLFLIFKIIWVTKGLILAPFLIVWLIVIFRKQLIKLIDKLF